MSAASAAE